MAFKSVVKSIFKTPNGLVSYNRGNTVFKYCRRKTIVNGNSMACTLYTEGSFPYFVRLTLHILLLEFSSREKPLRHCSVITDELNNPSPS